MLPSFRSTPFLSFPFHLRFLSTFFQLPSVSPWRGAGLTAVADRISLHDYMHRVHESWCGVRYPSEAPSVSVSAAEMVSMGEAVAAV